jgi:deaminated glutathione amidase
MKDVIVAAIQMNSTADVAVNLAAARDLLEESAGKGARLAVLPENFAFMGAREKDKLAHAEDEGRGPIQDFLRHTARRLQISIVAGTIPLRVPGIPDKVYAACLVYDEHGERTGRYDKIHLYDVDVPGAAEGHARYRESATIAAGDLEAKVVDSVAGKLGLTVCYDVRFPELFRRLAAEGAEVLCVPAAFTQKTGEAHWDVLLRARAVENQCYVIAPGQCGTHATGRATYGHSMIIGPWGEVLAERADGPGVVMASLSAARQAELRQTFPALTHRRLP